MVRDAVPANDVLPLVIGPHGGVLAGADGGEIPVQRTLLTARSVELDAVLVAGSTAPAPDAEVSLDAKAGAPSVPGVDPLVTLLLAEAYRHAKVVGGWGDAGDALAAAGCDLSAPGVVVDDDPGCRGADGGAAGRAPRVEPLRGLGPAPAATQMRHRDACRDAIAPVSSRRRRSGTERTHARPDSPFRSRR